MNETFKSYLLIYVRSCFGDCYETGVKLLLDSGLLNETAAQCAVICRYVDDWCSVYDRQRQEAFAATAETFGIAVYTVRHYYYGLNKRYNIFNKNKACQSIGQ